MCRILYIGRFELPDKEATANRVVSNAKLLRELGHSVVLAGWSEDVSTSNRWSKKEYFGFECYEKKKAKSSFEKFKMFTDASAELELLKSSKFDMLIAYDFPAVALKKLMKYCVKHHILTICDISEWYTNSNRHVVFRLVRAYDSYLRMKVLNKRTDGLIVISEYLEKYYAGQKMVRIPPLVDKQEEKWNMQKTSFSDGIRLIYAGWPSKTKERLDLLVSAIENLSQKYFVQLDVYGINEKQYKTMYGLEADISIVPTVKFHGRVSHLETLQAVKNADYSVIIRESNRKNNAGFPSKLVESISCGTPVLTTPISNVRDYVGEGKNGYIISISTLEQDLEQAICHRQEVAVEDGVFDYRNYLESMKTFLHFFDLKMENN